MSQRFLNVWYSSHNQKTGQKLQVLFSDVFIFKLAFNTSEIHPFFFLVYFSIRDSNYENIRYSFKNWLLKVRLSLDEFRYRASGIQILTVFYYFCRECSVVAGRAASSRTATDLITATTRRPVITSAPSSSTTATTHLKHFIAIS